MRRVDAYLKPIVDKALQMANAEEQKGSAPAASEKISDTPEGYTLLDHLAKCTKGKRPETSACNAAHTLSTDPTVLHDEILNIMIAGRDTVCQTW